MVKTSVERQNTMEELIKINYENNERPTVSGRELHDALGVETPYHKWFPRMCEYGFTENEDYSVTDIFVHNSKGGKQGYVDHQITCDMAKEICSLERNEKGKEFRQYFIEVEKAWNSPDRFMKRALEISNARVNQLRIKISNLTVENNVMKPKADYFDEPARQKSSHRNS